jgi:ethanolamine utilization protein EutA
VSREESVEPLELNPIWQQDNVSLRSVGIDIGSSGTQVAFSRLHLRRLGEDLTSRYVVVRRDTLYRSPVALTPYVDQRRIDDVGLAGIVGAAYEQARLHPDDIDTGVLILTGEALRRENSERIAAALSQSAGDLVCASAGHHMEAMLAAYGSGAARLSHDRQSRLLNVDIGGGTTKLGLIERGRVIATAALHVGGRLQVVDDAGRIVRLEPAGQEHARRAGFAWSEGDLIDVGALDRVAERMADAVVAAVATRPMPDPVARLFLTDPIDDLSRLDGIVFSGGVGEYVYKRETRDFGDLGSRLGAAVRRYVEADALPAPVLPAGECIRATVIGASQYSVQLSGNTTYISAPSVLLPRRNLQVVRPAFEPGDDVDAAGLAAAIRERVAAFAHEPSADIAVALGWDGFAAYERVAAFARGVADGLAARIDRGSPLYLVVDGDIALTLGSILRDELGVDNPLLVVDGVLLRDFDYVDLGSLREPSHTVPVTIKSLVFDAMS